MVIGTNDYERRTNVVYERGKLKYEGENGKFSKKIYK